eukprot:6089084-Prymnesium_polylepis.1
MNLQRMEIYMQNHRVPSNLRKRVKDYMYHLDFVDDTRDELEMTASLSPALQSDLVLASPHFAYLWKAFILGACEIEFIVTLPRAMEARVFVPYELPQQGRLYVLDSGV